MRVLALDLSSKTGWAFFDEGVLKDRGLVQLGQPILSFCEYPWCYMEAARAQAEKVYAVVQAIQPDQIVIEETNAGRNRYTQKFLEFLHCRILQLLEGRNVVYISSGVWRHKLELKLSAMDKRKNARIREAKKIAKQKGEKVDQDLLKQLGQKGRKGKKHLAVEYANATYGLQLKMKDNDIADAICLGTALLKGAEICDGNRDWRD